jgi:hypothetical protein
MPVRTEQIVGIAEGPPRRRPQPGGAGYSALGTMRESREH